MHGGALVAFAIAAMVSAPAFGESTEADAKPVVLGAIYDMTGSQSGLDIPSSRGARLAAEQANRKGGVLGRSVDLIVVDGETMPSAISAGTAALIAANPTVSALLGLSDTDMVLAAAPIAAKRGRLFVTSGATSPRLPAIVPRYLFLACFGDNVQAAAGAEWAYQERGARTAVVLFNASMSYTQLLHGYFERRFQKLGGAVVLTRGYAPRALDTAVADLPPADLIYLAAGPGDAVALSYLLRRSGVTTPILGGDAFDSADLWSKHPEIGDVYFTTHAYLGPDNPDPAAVAFRDAYAEAYPGETADAFAALGYDTVNLILTAVRQAGSASPDKVLAALPDVTLDGVTGTISYPDGSRIPKKSVAIVAIDGGRTRFVRSFTPAEIPSP
jgi:branched-chain amino acid transport system substrate-binding protein